MVYHLMASSIYVHLFSAQHLVIVNWSESGITEAREKSKFFLFDNFFVLQCFSKYIEEYI